MAYGVGKMDNEYARELHHVDASKTVFMAITYSLALRLTGTKDHAGAVRLVIEEWQALHANGIVPQRPRVRDAS